jgi:hypothetical protein
MFQLLHVLGGGLEGFAMGNQVVSAKAVFNGYKVANAAQSCDVLRKNYFHSISTCCVRKFSEGKINDMLLRRA